MNSRMCQVQLNTEIPGIIHFLSACHASSTADKVENYAECAMLSYLSRAQLLVSGLPFPGVGNVSPTEKVENWKRFQLGEKRGGKQHQQMKKVVSGSDNAVKIVKQTDVNRHRLKITYMVNEDTNGSRPIQRGI